MVDDRRNRIPQPWLWVLAGAALVGVLWFVVAVAPSLLVGSPPKGLSAADELKARNDVRATLVQALAGFAVAGGLVVTYRTYRQNRAEQDRNYQLNQTAQQRAYDRDLRVREEQDRTYERELYAKAVEQLGHEKAPVRLGSLYSLERLAEDKPERRQIIVDVICAYLRMPFSPTPPAIKPESEATEAPEVPAAETERRTEGPGDTWQQERQVRLTAQRILTKHLRDNRARDKRSTDPPDPRFWPGISLNLAGATLIEFDLHNGVVADADFRWATFTGINWFYGATFNGDAWFSMASFTDDVSFSDTSFSGDAWFGRATFNGDAEFSRANFTDDVSFNATFTGDAWFDDVTFTRYAGFSEATFTRRAGFSGATFTRGESSLSFERSRVLSPDAQHVWPTGWGLKWDGGGGCTVVRADDGLDTGLKPGAPPAAGTAGGG